MNPLAGHVCIDIASPTAPQVVDSPAADALDSDARDGAAAAQHASPANVPPGERKPLSAPLPARHQQLSPS